MIQFPFVSLHITNLPQLLATIYLLTIYMLRLDTVHMKWGFKVVKKVHQMNTLCMYVYFYRYIQSYLIVGSDFSKYHFFVCLCCSDSLRCFCYIIVKLLWLLAFRKVSFGSCYIINVCKVGNNYLLPIWYLICIFLCSVCTAAFSRV